MYSSRYQRWGSIKENKKVRKPRTRPRKRLIKKEKLAFFLDRVFGRKRVFWFSYFLVFFYKFPPVFVLMLNSFNFIIGVPAIFAAVQ